LIIETLVFIDYFVFVDICGVAIFGSYDELLQFCSPKRNRRAGQILESWKPGEEKETSFSEDFLGENK
jgi:hypothetical protein